MSIRTAVNASTLVSLSVPLLCDAREDLARTVQRILASEHLSDSGRHQQLISLWYSYATHAKVVGILTVTYPLNETTAVHNEMYV